jgi:cytochrome c-type biogenesis protein CcmH
MRRWLVLVAILIWWAQAGAIAIEDPLADPEKEEVYRRLTHEVRCLVCQNQTIADSTAPLAADLRREIRERVSRGESEAEITRFLLDRYGDFILYKPRFAGVTSLLWLAPAVLLVLGCLTLWRVLRRRATLPVPPEDQDVGIQ